MHKLQDGAICLVRLELFDYPGIAGLYQVAITTSDLETVTGACSKTIIEEGFHTLAEYAGFFEDNGEE